MPQIWIARQQIRIQSEDLTQQLQLNLNKPKQEDLKHRPQATYKVARPESKRLKESNQDPTQEPEKIVKASDHVISMYDLQISSQIIYYKASSITIFLAK